VVDKIKKGEQNSNYEGTRTVRSWTKRNPCQVTVLSHCTPQAAFKINGLFAGFSGTTAFFILVFVNILFNSVWWFKLATY